MPRGPRRARRPCPTRRGRVSRCRARDGSSRSCVDVSAAAPGRPSATTGSIRRASRSSPAAFWARAPAAESSTARARRPRPTPMRPPARRARTCSGPSRNWAGHGRRVEAGAASPFSVTTPHRPRGRRRRDRRLERRAAAPRPRRVPRAAPARTTGQRLGELADGRRALVDERLDRPGDEAGVLEARLAHRRRATPRGSSAEARRDRSSATTGRPSSANAAEATARPDEPGALAQVDERRAPADRAGEPVVVAVARPRPRGEVGRSPRRDGRRRAGASATRSGTRSERVRNGRSASSTSTRPPSTSGPPGMSRPRRPGAAGASAGQLEREADARAAPRDVVVEVAVEPLEARVDVGRERHEQQLDVVRVERERAGEPAQPDVLAALSAASAARSISGSARSAPASTSSGQRRPSRRAGRRPGRPRCTGRGTGRRGRVVGAPPVDGGAHARLDDLEPAEEVRERRVGDRQRAPPRSGRRRAGAVGGGTAIASGRAPSRSPP